MGHSSRDIEVQSDESNLTAEVSDEELEAVAITRTYAAMTFPQLLRSISCLCAVVMNTRRKT
jgi:hypothetical protein